MRLLLAEDERELSDALVMILRHNRYEVDAVFNGQDALDYLEGQEYDGAILDIMMPKMDGLTVLRKVRLSGNPVPVLLLTARSEIDDRVTGLDSGANDYLTKPFDTKELLARIRAMTRKQATAVDNVLQCGNVTLDRAGFALRTQQGEVHLGSKEFQMMEMFLANPGQILSADRFMEKIWGYDSDAEISVVWVNISYLRKKLASLGANVEIRAIRNQGYTLKVNQ